MRVVGASFRFYPNSDDPETMRHTGKVVRVVMGGERMGRDRWYTVECVETGWRGDALRSELVPLKL